MTTDGGGSAVPETAAWVSQLPPRYLERRAVGSIDSRLRQLEGQGHRCPACGLTPEEHGRPVAVYPDEPNKGFQGDTGECCGRCGRNLYTVLRAVRDGTDEEGEGAYR